MRSAEVRNRSLLAADFAAGQLPKGDKGDKGDQGPQGPQGLQGPKGDPGDSKFSYVHMNSNGTFDPARSKDVLDATVFANGFTYCIDFAGIDFPTTAAKIVQATLTTQGGNDPGEIVAGLNGCSNADVANGDVYVHTSNSAGAGAGQEFDLLIVTP